jgi:1-deoxy-D-xylulose-5-phosphate synthase
VLEALQRFGKRIAVLQLGLPDRFIDQGDPGIQIAHAGLNKESIAKAIRERVAA